MRDDSTTADRQGTEHINSKFIVMLVYGDGN